MQLSDYFIDINTRILRGAVKPLCFSQKEDFRIGALGTEQYTVHIFYPWGWSLQSIELEETDGLLRFESISAESLHCSKSLHECIISYFVQCI